MEACSAPGMPRTANSTSRCWVTGSSTPLARDAANCPNWSASTANASPVLNWFAGGIIDSQLSGRAATQALRYHRVPTSTGLDRDDKTQRPQRRSKQGGDQTPPAPKCTPNVPAEPSPRPGVTGDLAHLGERFGSPSSF